MSDAERTWRSPALGDADTIDLSGGTMRYHDRGSGPVLVFVHGAMVNANVWRDVVEALAGECRCIALDLPFGGHIDPMPPDTNFSPPALAGWIADAIEALDLDDVTLVGNDTGGALCQIVMAQRPERIGRVVLTSCDAFENFPPPALRPFLKAMGLPGAMPIAFAGLRLGIVRRHATSKMQVTKRPLDSQVADSYWLPLLRGGNQRDTKKLVLGMAPRHTLEAAEQFADFEQPVLIAWSSDDRVFSRKYAARLADALPHARLEWIPDALTLSSEDQPERLAELIAEFVRAPVVQQR